ncbi:S41 family peptidase [Accumulibacter sp.]|uniref:S41 family peptidase n=1 Tax=Accumulibacter sp. TaxID=2053492 RepID=UPI001ACE1FC7|nr:S41 family peptidase [Accumulibacter sp.]MBN8455903.1 hypothetical protein [Accumulibacter sp.]
MNAIPGNLSRVPTMMASRMSLSTIAGTTRDMLRVQEEIVTGKRLNRPSDDVVGTSAASVIDDILERREQRLSNLAQADAVVSSLDAALGDLSDLVLEAKSVGLSQIGIGSDASTRENQAQVIDAILNAAVDIANRSQRGIHFFGGSAHAQAPIEGLYGALRYVGQGKGMVADLPLGDDLRITMGGDQAYGALSARVEGFADLNPGLTAATRLSDLGGARGQGIAKGSLTVTVNAVQIDVDLSDADTIGDVTSALQAAMPKLLAAKGLVFDMRGYPAQAAYDVLERLLRAPGTSARWMVPIFTRPDRAGVTWTTSSWQMAPKAPALPSSNVVFLTDGRAISYAESIMGIVEAYKLGEIVGNTTAGTNGNVNPFEVPGGYRISWTGMKVAKHDGSRHHGVGIAPTVKVVPTAAGIAAGRDRPSAGGHTLPRTHPGGGRSAAATRRGPRLRRRHQWPAGPAALHRQRVHDPAGILG